MAMRVAFLVLAGFATGLAACGGGQQGTPPAPTAQPAPVSAPPPAKSLADVMAGDHRSAANRARDQYRHPRETLEFFGIRPEMTVIEIWPEAGWYTEILAPYLHDRGRYIAAHFDPDAKEKFFRDSVREFREKLAQRPDLYGAAEVTVLQPPEKTEIAPAESADMVVTFRNIHNWMGDGQADAVFAAMYRALKPGGVLGVVEHRAAADKPQDPKAASGYVRQDYAIRLAERAGFVLEETSEVNANPKDTRDYPGGVWTLPPNLSGVAEKDRAKYLAIGESDRFTLRFRRPGSTAGVGEGAAPATDQEE